MDFSPITLPIANLHHDICQFAPLSGQAGYNAACSYFTYYKETIQYTGSFRAWKCRERFSLSY